MKDTMRFDSDKLLSGSHTSRPKREQTVRACVPPHGAGRRIQWETKSCGACLKDVHEVTGIPKFMHHHGPHCVVERRRPAYQCSGASAVSGGGNDSTE